MSTAASTLAARVSAAARRAPPPAVAWAALTAPARARPLSTSPQHDPYRAVGPLPRSPRIPPLVGSLAADAGAGNTGGGSSSGGGGGGGSSGGGALAAAGDVYRSAMDWLLWILPPLLVMVAVRTYVPDEPPAAAAARVQRWLAGDGEGGSGGTTGSAAGDGGGEGGGAPAAAGEARRG
jgi:hypothetical protein